MDGSWRGVGHNVGIGAGLFGFSGNRADPLPAARTKTGVLGIAHHDAAAVGVVGIAPLGRGGVFAGKEAQIRLKPSTDAMHAGDRGRRRPLSSMQPSVSGSAGAARVGHRSPEEASRSCVRQAVALGAGSARGATSHFTALAGYPMRFQQ
jgi:hypothetical protein